MRTRQLDAIEAGALQASGAGGKGRYHLCHLVARQWIRHAAAFIVRQRARPIGNIGASAGIVTAAVILDLR